MSLAFGFALPHWQPLSGGFSPASLFAGGTVAGAWYDPSDLSTLFTTSAGTTPVAMPGLGAAVSVGLMLDKSQGLVLGSELLSNGDFSNGTTGWSAPAGQTLTVENGAGKALNTSTGAYLGAPIAVVSGTWYKFTYTAISDGTSKSVGAALGNAVGTGTYLSQTDTGGYAFGTRTFYWLATVTGTVFPWFFAGSQTGTNYILIDNVSVQAIAGNHAIAFNNTTARPELRARVNLLTYSEEFDNGAWTNLNAATNIVANATTAPNGTNTADFFRVAATTNTDHLIRATNTVSVAASTYILTWRIKANGITRFRMAVASETSLANRAWVNVNLSTRAQTGGNDGSGFTFVSSDVTLEDAYGFQTVSLTYTTTVGTVIPYIVMQDASGNFTFAGTVDTGLYIWGADLRPANIGANVPAYQRIADANTYDTSGFPLYLFFDGIDDSMYTPANLNLSGTDKVSVFAGVRKLSTSTGFVAETSAAAESNNGAFRVGTDSGGIEYFISSRGTTSQEVDVDNAAYTSPVTNVVQSSFDIAAPLVSVRINSAAVGSNSGSQGAGNYGTYPLYIGSRNNASFRFNGQIYSLIIAGSAVSAGNISATEQWVAGKTGIQI